MGSVRCRANDEMAESRQLSVAARHELAVIRASLGVLPDSVKFSGEEGLEVKISFVLENEVPVGDRAAPILPEEPIALVYGSEFAIGRSTPIVLSDRPDFPRELGHLNPVAPGHPANFCLARAGLQPIYDRFGVEGVLTRLRTWMRDAMTGGLMIDGWEPVPYATKTEYRGGILNVAAFQAMAAAGRTQIGGTTGIARITLPTDGDYVFVDEREIAADSPPHKSALARAIEGETVDGLRIGVPWIFVWSSAEPPIDRPIFGCWTTYKEMRTSLDLVGLAAELERLIGNVFANGCDCKHAPGRKTLVILVGLWRPVPLAENIFGLSEDAEARRVEIRAVTLEVDLAENIIADETKLRAILMSPVPGPAMYRWISGITDLAPAMLLGNGALGSAIADHLLRAGLGDLGVVDSDLMLPHNMARHRATIEDLFQPKVVQLKSFSRRISRTGEPVLRPFKDDVVSLSDELLLAKVAGANVIIDATAEERVRGRLAEASNILSRQIVRVEIYRHGQLGLQFVTGDKGNPNLLALYYTACYAALSDESLVGWIESEHQLDPAGDELLLGFGCASQTVRLPNYVVAQHAAAFMPTILEALGRGTRSGIGISALDTAHRPMGWKWLDVPEFHQFAVGTTARWRVQLHPDVTEFLARERAHALPNETGGYLYGGWDLASQEIIIVAASGLPPGSKSTPIELTLGPAGATAVERKIIRRARGRLFVCGSWHSHPDADTELSARDRRTMNHFREIDQPKGVPTLFAVVGDKSVGIHLEV